MNRELDDLLDRVARIEDGTSQRLRADRMERLAPARPGTSGDPVEPTVGFSPFAPATTIAGGAIDFAALGSGLLGVPAIALGAAAADGVAQKLVRSDATIAAFDVTAPTTSALGDAAAVGAAAFAARRDHRHGREAFAVPAIALGTAAAAGVATTPIRSDATILAFDVTVPTTQALGDAASVGAAVVAARRDHKHAMPALSTATPLVESGAGAVGVGVPSSREDHVHPAATSVTSFAAPALTLGTANADGVATTAVRTDATILAFDATAPSTQAFGDAAAVGAAAIAARRDHKHAMMADPVTAHVAAGDPHTVYALDTDLTTHAGAADPHTGYRLESADHSHASTGLQGGPVAQVSNSAVAAAADYVARIKIAADTTYRAFLGLTSGDAGALEFGPGAAAARDVRAFRLGAGILVVDSNGASAATQVIVESTAGQRAVVDMRVAGDSFKRLRLSADATLIGIEFGAGGAGDSDTNLYRDAADILATNDFMRIRPPNATTPRAFTLLVAGEANNRIQLGMTAAGVASLSLGPGGATAPSQVVGTRKTGWATATGTATRTTFATTSVTLAQLAERVKALIDDLHATAGHGLIGT